MAGKSEAHAETQDSVQKSVITVEALAEAIASIARSVNTLTNRVEQLAARPEQSSGALPMAPTPDQLLKKIRGLHKGESTTGHTFVDKLGRRYAFRPETIVELIDEDKLAGWRKVARDGKPGRLGPNEKLYGVVMSIMYWRKKDAVPKYRVDFGKGFGDDGVMEYQLRAVS